MRDELKKKHLCKINTDSEKNWDDTDKIDTKMDSILLINTKEKLKVNHIFG